MKAFQIAHTGLCIYFDSVSVADLCVSLDRFSSLKSTLGSLSSRSLFFFLDFLSSSFSENF